MEMVGPAMAPARQRIEVRGETAVRLASIALGAGFAVLAVALYRQESWATSLWPWPDVRMTFIFLASIAAAIAAPAIWIGLTGEIGAFAAIGLNSGAVQALAASYLAQRAIRQEEPRLAVAAALCAVLALLGFVTFAWSRHRPVHDPRPMPRFVRWFFGVVAVVLVTIGTLLLLQIPDVFPWELAPQTSSLFGAIFIGPSLFFAYAVARPRWAFAAGPLWSFLAYDVVLMTPYVKMLWRGGSEGTSALYADYGYVGLAATSAGDGVNERSLVVYLAVLVVSAAVALYTLLLHPATRLGARRG